MARPSTPGTRLLPRGRRRRRPEGSPSCASRGGRVSSGGARGRRRRRARPLPGLHRPARALGAAVVRRPLPDAEARPGLHDRGDQPGRARAGAGRSRPARRPAGVPPAAGRPRAGDVAMVDGRGVPRRARRHASRALARPLDRPRRRARPGARRRTRRAVRRGPASDAPRGAGRLRGRRADALLRARLPARAPTPRRTSSSRSRRRPRPSARRSCRTCATRATGCWRRSGR